MLIGDHKFFSCLDYHTDRNWLSFCFSFTVILGDNGVIVLQLKSYLASTKIKNSPVNMNREHEGSKLDTFQDN